MSSIKFLFTSIATACLLAACGGGGGGGGGEASTSGGTDSIAGSDSSGTGTSGGGTSAARGATEDIQGLWLGSASGGNLQWDTYAVAMKDGRFYLVFSEYGFDTFPENRDKIGGFAVGKGTASGGNFSFNGGQEFNFEDAPWHQRSAELSATYTSKGSLQGRVSYPNTFPRDFSANYSTSHEGAALFSDISFNNTSLRSIQGTFLRPDPAGGSDNFQVHMIVGADGSLSNRYPDRECNVSGRLTPDAERKVFEATVNFNSPSAMVECPYPAGTTFTGVAFVKNTVGFGQQPKFHMVLTNAAQDQGVAFEQFVMQPTQPTQ